MLLHQFVLNNCKHVWMRLKLDLHDCWSRDITIALSLVMPLVLISFCSFFFTQDVITVLLFHLEYRWIVQCLIRSTNCLKIGWSVLPETLCNNEIQRISGEIKESCTFFTSYRFLNYLSLKGSARFYHAIISALYFCFGKTFIG